LRKRDVARLGWAVALIAVAASAWAWGAPEQQRQVLIPRSVLKLIIDHPALAGYLHPEIEGRVPLLVSDHLLAPGVTPSKFGQAVRILGDRELGSQPHLRFRSFEVQDSRATVVVDYKIEGVEALFVLENTASGWWKVVDVKVSEH